MNDLDPGIRDIVARVQAAGFVTTDSGDGVSKPADERTIDAPHVVCAVSVGAMVWEAHRLWALLGPDWRVEASYSPTDGAAILLAILSGQTEP